MPPLASGCRGGIAPAPASVLGLSFVYRVSSLTQGRIRRFLGATRRRGIGRQGVTPSLITVCLAVCLARAPEPKQSKSAGDLLCYPSQQGLNAAHHRPLISHHREFALVLVPIEQPPAPPCFPKMRIGVLRQSSARGPRTARFGDPSGPAEETAIVSPRARLCDAGPMTIVGTPA